MFKTIFRKQFATYIMALSVSLAVLFVVLISFYRSHIINQKSDMLQEQAKRITGIYVQSYVPNFGFFVNDRIKNAIVSELSVLQDYLSARCFFTNSKYEISLATADMFTPGEQYVLGQEYVSQIEKGKPLTFQGSLNGLIPEDSLTVLYPVIINESVMAVVGVSSSMTELNQNISEIITITLWCVAITAVFSFILIYFTSKTISKPIRQISDAASVISAGNFDKRIEYASRDEVGQLAESFNNMAKSLDDQEKQRRDFIANISHDLRSPLTSMRGFLQAMLDGTIPQEKQNHYLSVVLEESERLSKLANDILDLNKIEKLELGLEKTNFNLNELIRKTILMFETKITSMNLTMSIVFAEEDSMVFADSDKIQRVLYNLIDNAVKFTPQDGSIRIETKRINGKIITLIRDSGIGISKEEQQRVFDRLYKSDSSRGEDKTGSGLGLSIVREFIRAHGETVRLESTPGKGSEFGFSLPLAN